MTVFGFSDLAFMGAVTVAGYDPDAQAYITTVETADGQALETGVRDAINDFVVGCKADGIWNAIKASCILAGARTLNGALVPLVGAAPTNFNFVSGDYNRKTGLVGDGSTKYLNTNRNNNADPQDNSHISVYVTTLGNAVALSLLNNFTVSGANHIGFLGARSRNSSSTTIRMAAGLNGISRSLSSSFTQRAGSTATTINQVSQTPANDTMTVYRGQSSYGNHRLAFYSIGESLDLALLDARVTTLINAFAAAIP